MIKNFIKKWWKKILAILGFGVVLAFGGDAVFTTENEFILQIASQEQSFISLNGKYQAIPRTSAKITGKNITYEITEYQTAKGEKGYQILLVQDLPDQRIVKSFGYGVQAGERTWQKIITPPKTATSTKI